MRPDIISPVHLVERFGAGVFTVYVYIIFPECKQPDIKLRRIEEYYYLRELVVTVEPEAYYARRQLVEKYHIPSDVFHR